MAEMETGRIDLALGAFDGVSGALYHRRLFQQDYVVLHRQHHPLMREGSGLKEFWRPSTCWYRRWKVPTTRLIEALEKPE